MPMYCNNFELEESRDEFLLRAEPPESFAIYPNDPGPPGPPGEGVPEGGTTGQMLVKASDTDYDTEWADVAADAGDIAYDDAETYEDGTVGKAVSDLNSAISEININKADVIVSSASGAIASFSDGMNAPIVSLTASIEPIQSGSGDPSPTNICPISGHTGATVYRTGFNVWDEEWEVGAISSTTGENSSGSGIRSKNYISVLPNTNYYAYVTGQGSQNLKTRWYDRDKNFIGATPSIVYNTEFTTPSNAYFVRFCPQDVYGSTYNHDISINYPSTDHDYHAYTGNTYPITFPSEAGTVYGGTLTINEDGSGTLTVDRVCKLLRIARNLSGTYQGSIIYNSASAETSDANFAKPITCNRLKYVGIYPTGNPDWKYGACINANYTSFNLWVKDGAFADLAEATTWLEANDTQLCYYLAQPLVYTLTSEQVGTVITTLKGQNNVWADTGEVSLDYRADTKLYIDKKLAELVAQIVNS